MAQTGEDNPISGAPIIGAIAKRLARDRALAEKALAQLRDEDFFVRLNERQNSIHVIIKHMAGNMLSRWTDFLTTDGEKPTRNREQEFVEEAVPRAAVMELWNRGWDCMFSALAELSDADIGRTVVIRTEPMTVIDALARQLSHYAYHIGQILLIAKHVCGERWQYVTIPPGESEQFNQKMRAR